MFRNYLHIAYRNLFKNKGYSAINIFGLAVGLASCLLILLYVFDEFNYYQYNEKADLIYRVEADIKFILIACLGLFGLITFSAGQSTKEIGIRKVLGASMVNVSSMLAKDFMKLVFIAALIAYPLAWWAMNKWLQGFAYRITINW